MSREWKPGDVAIIRPEGAEYEVLGLRDENGWAHIREYTSSVGAHSRWTSAGLVTVVRPLVVIDPESLDDRDRLFTMRLRESIEAVLRVSIDDRQWAGISVAFQDAIRSLIAPPKPDEPQGLGAVVEDADGHKWLRCFEGAVSGSVWRRSGDHAEFRAAIVKYADINAVRVLSEGVTA